MMLTIEDLPNEVLEVVFSKLFLSDRKSVRLVNKRWLSICNGTRFTKLEHMVVEFKDLHQIKTPRGCLQLIINDKESHQADFWTFHGTLPQEQAEFWIDHGDSVKSVKVTDRKLYFPTINKIIDQCCNVKKLVLDFSIEENENNPENFNDFEDDNSFSDSDDDDDDDSDSDDDDNDDPENDLLVYFIKHKKYAYDNCGGVCSKLESLSTLFLCGENSLAFITSPTYVRLINCVPNLKRLVFHQIDITKSLHKHAIMALIAKQSLTLKELIIINSYIATDAFIEQVLQLLGPQFANLHLAVVPLVAINCLTKYSGKFLSLTKLALDNIYFRGFLSQVVCFKNLKCLSFHGSLLKDEDLEHILDLQHLECLDISSTACTSPNVQECFERKNYPKLVALALNAVTDFSLIKILPNLRNLKLLDLGRCPTIGTLGLEAIINNCQQLTYLSLNNCTGFTDLIEPYCINDLANLMFLNLDGCRNVIPGDILQLRFKKLIFLGLDGVSLPENGLRELLKNCPKLEKVHLSNINEEGRALSDAGLLLFDSCHEFSIFKFCSDEEAEEFWP